MKKLLLVLFLIVACSKAPSMQEVPLSGKLSGDIFTATIAGLPAGIEGISIGIDNMNIYSKAENSYFEVLSDKKTINYGEDIYLADIPLPPAKYNKLMIDLGEVTIRQDGMEKTAIMPSDQVELSLPIEKTGGYILIRAAFLLDKSIHRTLDNEIIFAPVIMITALKGVEAEKIGADVNIISSSSEDISIFGMDIGGNMVSDFWINEKLKIEEGQVMIR